jgi:hypothetical protein
MFCGIVTRDVFSIDPTKEVKPVAEYQVCQETREGQREEESPQPHGEDGCAHGHQEV